MKGECCYRKFDPARPQCTNTEVYHCMLKLNNLTDEWTWCSEHMDALDRVVELLTSVVPCKD